MYVCVHTCESQKTTCGSRFSDRLIDWTQTIPLGHMHLHPLSCHQPWVFQLAYWNTNTGTSNRKQNLKTESHLCMMFLKVRTWNNFIDMLGASHFYLKIISILKHLTLFGLVVEQGEVSGTPEPYQVIIVVDASYKLSTLSCLGWLVWKSNLLHHLYT